LVKNRKSAVTNITFQFEKKVIVKEIKVFGKFFFKLSRIPIAWQTESRYRQSVKNSVRQEITCDKLHEKYILPSAFLIKWSFYYSAKGRLVAEHFEILF
jgi:U3 small nucleolar RNA-associated protein 14